MSIIVKWLLCGGVCIGAFSLVSNLRARKYNESLNNLMSIGVFLFILLSNVDPPCMVGPKEAVAPKTNSLITGERQTDSGDYTQLGTVESQVSLQESTAQELQSTVKDCEKTASFTQDFAVGGPGPCLFQVL